MIIVLFGQPHSGKTTLAEAMQLEWFLQYRKSYPVVDGDEIRRIFKNKDFSKEGRLKNLNRISDIATFLQDKYELVLVSAVYPLKEARAYLESIYDNVFWVYLTYEGERGRESFHVKDFDYPESEIKNLLKINTSQFDIQESLKMIMNYVAEKNSR